MIACVCNAIREDKLREAVRQGARSPGSAYARLGCKVKCATCLPFAREIIADEAEAVSCCSARSAA